MKTNTSIIHITWCILTLVNCITSYSVHSSKKWTAEMDANGTNITTNTTTTTSDDAPKCSYEMLQHCGRYIKNIIILYTGTGGWILVAVIVLGLLFLLVSHFAPRRRGNVALGIIQSMNIPLGMNVSENERQLLFLEQRSL